jgi:hypothetical protein
MFRQGILHFSFGVLESSGVNRDSKLFRRSNPAAILCPEVALDRHRSRNTQFENLGGHGIVSIKAVKEENGLYASPDAGEGTPEQNCPRPFPRRDIRQLGCLLLRGFNPDLI